MRNLYAFFFRYHVFFVFILLEIIAIGMLIQSHHYQSSRFASSSNKWSGKILEKVQQSEGLTDKELLTVLSKNDVILESDFNKILLDLEIKGLISVSWQTKNIKRIEYVTIDNTDDEYEKQIQESEDKDYEASFPNSD